MAATILYTILVLSAGLLFIVAATYALTVGIDRLCSSSTTERIFSPISNRANLWGLCEKERIAVLEKLFSQKGTIRAYQKKKLEQCRQQKQQQQQQNVTRLEIEMAEIKTATPSQSQSDSSSAPGSKVGDQDAIKPDSLASPSSTNTTQNIELEVPRINDVKDLSIETPLGVLRSQMSADLRENVCPICLVEYAEGEKVMTGTACSHLYHFKCIMSWMKQGRDHCPFCRIPMMSSRDFRGAAILCLGLTRVEELSRDKDTINEVDSAAASRPNNRSTTATSTAINTQARLPAGRSPGSLPNLQHESQPQEESETTASSRNQRVVLEDFTV